MLADESLIIQELCLGIQDQRILNVCSSDQDFYEKRQPHIWTNVMQPLLRYNELVNVDLKEAPGVDIVADCTDMHMVPDRSFDVVLFCSGIEHIEAPRKALSELERVLKDDGVAVISAPGVYPKHDDPIDTLLRFPTRSSWERYLDGHWVVDEYRTTRPRPAKAFYKFDRDIYATIVRCRKFSATPQGRLTGAVRELSDRLAKIEQAVTKI